MWIFLILVVILVVYVISAYNSLVKCRNWVDESWAQIDVQLNRRYDLIPNLVNTVKGYAKHERETLEQVINARNRLMQMSEQGLSRKEIMAQNDNLSNSLKYIFALHESYPDLKANQNFLMLQEELTTTENKISYARQLYNTTAVKYNSMIQVFPKVIIAKMFGFTKKELFTVTSKEQREAVKVEF